MHLLKPAPQTQTATAHLLTAWTVYFDGQGTQKLPCGKIPPPSPRGGGGGGYRLAHGLKETGRIVFQTSVCVLRLRDKYYEPPKAEIKLWRKIAFGL